MASLLRRLNRAAVALAAVAMIAVGLRFWSLGSPPTRVFDEVYYSKAGCVFVGYSNEACDIRSDDEKFWVRTRGDTGSWVHPPLGKWTIGLGELLLGTDAFGWRAAGAAFGALTVVLTAAVAQLLFRSPAWTFTTGLLLATEHLSFVQSRIAMVDVFVACWIVLGFLLLLVDRRWIERRTRPPPAQGIPPRPTAPLEVSREVGLEAGSSVATATEPLPTRADVPSPLFRPWRLAAGVALGAALATKWSGLTGIGGAVLLSLLWEVSRRRRAGVPHAAWRAIQQESFGQVLSLLAVPAVVYLASYAGWFVRFGLDLGEWFRLQGDMAGYHLNLQTIDESGQPIHPYVSQAWKWILVWRPVLYYARYPADDVRRVIYALGSPAIFWGSLIAIAYLALAWWRRRDWRAGFVLVSVLSLYLPWFLVSRPQFIFYMTPVVPFLVLAVVHGLRDLSEARIHGSRSRPWLPVAVGFVVLSVGLFAFFWPVLTGWPITTPQWELRSWFPSWV